MTIKAQKDYYHVKVLQLSFAVKHSLQFIDDF